MKHNPGEPELSRPLAIDKISPNGVEENLVASDTERRHVAERFGLLDLPSLSAHLDVRARQGGRIVAVTGILTADVVQQCVVTLEPLPAHIEHGIDVIFAPAGDEPVPGAAQIDPDEEDVEPIVGGVIDLGELVAQHLGVALDPYPRKPGLAFVEAEYGDEEGGANPFADLAKLPKKPKT